MALGNGGTNIPVADLIELASTINSEAARLDGELSRMRAACERPGRFEGSAAGAYDDYLVKWSQSQAALVENMRGAAGILSRLAQVTEENAQVAAVAFNV